VKPHDYGPAQALELLLLKLDAADSDLAAQVRAAIDAGKDIDEQEPSSSRRKNRRKYRKAVRLSEEEALAAAVDVLQAYFVEQPLFVSSAMDNVRAAALDGPRKEFDGKRAWQAVRKDAAGAGDEKFLEIELRVETQLTAGGDETYRLHRPSESQLTQQLEAVARVRRLLTFGSE
jgi:hypothetical protein